MLKLFLKKKHHEKKEAISLPWDNRGRLRVKASDSCFRWLIAQTQDMQIKLANKRRAACHHNETKRNGYRPYRESANFENSFSSRFFFGAVTPFILFYVILCFWQKVTQH